MVGNHQTVARKSNPGTGIMPGKWSILIFVQAFGVIFPLTLIPIGAWGDHSFGFCLLCAAVQSAVIYYGKDLFDQSKRPFLRSLITFFITTVAIGALGFVIHPQEIWLYGSYCYAFGGPTYVFFLEFHLWNLPIALAISPLWMTIRRTENTVRTLLGRQACRKTRHN